MSCRNPGSLVIKTIRFCLQSGCISILIAKSKKNLEINMKSKSLKLSSLCLVMMGGYQGLAAETQTQLLPLFKATEIPALCDANLASMQKDILIIENRKIKNKA